jgi:hypothetical protein
MDPDLDPAFYLNVDPDPEIQTNADLCGPSLEFLHDNKKQKHTYVGTVQKPFS